MRIGAKDKAEDVWHIVRHLAANGRLKSDGKGLDAKFELA